MSSIKSIFITGTDTGIGKTRISSGLLMAATSRSQRAVGMKPVASGCVLRDGVWCNEDADALRACSSEPLRNLPEINVYAFEEAIAPHLAAAHGGVEIDLTRLHLAYQILQEQADLVVVEGVGGWSVPLSSGVMQADWVRALELPVILVVGMRLGCINHALLSARAIAADGCNLRGWIVNNVDADTAYLDENIDSIRQRLDAPLLAQVRHQPSAEELIGDLSPVLDMLR